MNRSIRMVLPFLVLHFILLSGCLSPIAMHQAVLSYDQTVTQVSSEQLLMNIVRARYHRPVHFTTVSSVAATFDFRMTAGVAPPEGDARGLVAPLFGTTVAENPTTTIIPLGGAEFEQRLLTPLEENQFLALLELGGDLGMGLRMMGDAMRLETLPRDAVFSVKFNERFYSVEDTPLAIGEGSNWNLKAFSMLYQLFQMTHNDGSHSHQHGGVPLNPTASLPSLIRFLSPEASSPNRFPWRGVSPYYS